MQKTSGFQAISRSCRCRRARPNSIPKKTSGSSCVKIGCRTASLNPSTTFSITAATLGGRSSINPGKSCLSLAAIGQPSVSQSEDWYKTRPGFAALLDRIEGNGVRTVIVEDASRFARELVTQELGILALIKRGVRVLTASGDDLTDSSDPSRKMMRQIAGSFAEYEKARLVAKLKAARERKRLATGKCEGRKSHAEMSPEMVQDRRGAAPAQARQFPAGHRCRAGSPRLCQRQRKRVLSGIGSLNARRLRLNAAAPPWRSYGPILEAIFLAQRLGLLVAAERGERIGGDAGGVPGPGVVRA